jgi:hypothetical protein
MPITTAGTVRITAHHGMLIELTTPCMLCDWMTSWAAMNPTLRSRTQGNKNAEP